MIFQACINCLGYEMPVMLMDDCGDVLTFEPGVHCDCLPVHAFNNTPAGDQAAHIILSGLSNSFLLSLLSVETVHLFCACL